MRKWCTVGFGGKRLTVTASNLIEIDTMSFVLLQETLLEVPAVTIDDTALQETNIKM
jgi:hypothetical protein